MRKDQIFVLLLIVMLPMSGCFDDAVGEAEGAENDSTDDSSTTTVRNIVKTLHIPDGQTHVITLNGSTTYQIMDIYAVNEEGTWRSPGTLSFKMECSNNFSSYMSIYTGANYGDMYLPILPNLTCTVELNWVPSGTHGEKIIIFEEAELLPL